MNWFKNKKIQIIFFLFNIIVFFILKYIKLANLYSFWNDVHVAGLFIFGIYTIFSFFFIFIKFKTWINWLKIISTFSFISFWIIVDASSTDGDFFVPSQILFASIFIIFYSLISLGIIIYHSFKKN